MQAESDTLRSNGEFWQSQALEVTFFVRFEDIKSEKRVASLALHLHQVEQGACTPKLSNMFGTQQKSRGFLPCFF